MMTQKKRMRYAFLPIACRLASARADCGGAWRRRLLVVPSGRGLRHTFRAGSVKTYRPNAERVASPGCGLVGVEGFAEDGAGLCDDFDGEVLSSSVRAALTGRRG